MRDRETFRIPPNIGGRALRGGGDDYGYDLTDARAAWLEREAEERFSAPVTFEADNVSAVVWVWADEAARDAADATKLQAGYYADADAASAPLIVAWLHGDHAGGFRAAFERSGR